ncbi:MAG TPA: hypothetical protein VN875_18575 [Candidatus Binatus sp.]|nr:hypothetical protein [Candidatus Binatus sp.]
MAIGILKALLEQHSDSQKLDWEIEQATVPRRIFLLSPVNAAGVRAKMMISEKAEFQLAVQLREQGLPLGEVFSFISGLYFRGKMAYANAFGGASSLTPSAYVIVAGRGLIPPHTIVRQEDLKKLSAVPIDHRVARFREPLERDARALLKILGPHGEVILLGSIATPKYVEPLLGVFGERLLFPSEFVGRGDMSRGGLMLRCARENVQLTYVPVATAQRHGPRAPKLPKPTRRKVRG